MAKYNFETRELVPYREDWNRGGKYIKIQGALWYIREEDGLFLLDTVETRTHQNKRPYNRYQVAKGLPAALLAQGDALVLSDFDIRGCYQEYFKVVEELFPTKPIFDTLTILDDWEYTLQHSLVVEHNTSGFADNYSLMLIAQFLRALTNPYRANSLEQKISHNYYYTCLFNGKTEAQFIFSQMPTIRERTEAPLIYVHDMGQPIETAKLQASGFMAAIINLAIYYYWERRWTEYNFTDINVIRDVIQAYRKQKSIIDIANIQKLSFNLPVEVEDICKAYMAAFEPIMSKVWKMSPKVQLACIEGDDIYTYIYKHEIDSPEIFLHSELYANLTPTQKQTITNYGLRFLEWMRRTHPISRESQLRVMNAIASEMPPIQVTIQNDVKVTHVGEDEEKPKKKRVKDVTIIKSAYIPKATKETLCPYINADALAEKGTYTVEQYQTLLRQQCEQMAKVLVKFLIQQEKYGNLDFHGAGIKAIYTTLRRDCFPTMRDYSYQNFAAAWKEASKNLT